MNEIIDWITLIIMWACIFSWIFQIILIKKERKKINTTYKDIQKNARLIDEYIISLDNPAELATERCVNIVTNLRTIIMTNRRTIDSYFDKFNKLERKIKKVESKVKRHESPQDNQKIRINISMRDDLYIATSEDLLGLFVADRNIIDLFNEIPEVIKAINNEIRRDFKRAEEAQD